jgi:GST-like protein
MEEVYVVYGASGSGSVPVEAALSLIDLPYRVQECAPWESTEQASELARTNPMAQVPALALPSGELLTETAAILIWLADAHPNARLSPTVDQITRPAYLRWMSFVSSAIYALYWIRDDPSRITDRAEDHEGIKARLSDRIIHCWRVMEAETSPGRHILGDDLSVLDLYVATASRWSPGRRRFNEVAPRLADVVGRVDAEPRLAKLWAERFPFVEGWER